MEPSFHAAKTWNAPRTGLLHVRGQTYETPLLIGSTSRGAMPHISPDLVERHTATSGYFAAAEDCKHCLPRLEDVTISF